MTSITSQRFLKIILLLFSFILLVFHLLSRFGFFKVKVIEEEEEEEKKKEGPTGFVTFFYNLQTIYHYLYPAGTAGLSGGVDGSIRPSYLLRLLTKVKETEETNNLSYHSDSNPQYCGIDFGCGNSSTMFAIAYLLNIYMYGFEYNPSRYHSSLAFQLHCSLYECLLISSNVLKCKILQTTNNMRASAFDKIDTPIRFIYMFCLGWSEAHKKAVLDWIFSENTTYTDNLKHFITDIKLSHYRTTNKGNVYIRIYVLIVLYTNTIYV